MSRGQLVERDLQFLSAARGQRRPIALRRGLRALPETQDLLRRDAARLPDFPHRENEWPNSPPITDKIYADIPEDDKSRIWAGNAGEFFHLA